MPCLTQPPRGMKHFFFSEGIRKNTAKSQNLWEMSCWKNSLGTLYMMQLENNKQSRDLGGPWFDTSSNFFMLCGWSLPTGQRNLYASPLEHKAHRLHLVWVKTCKALLSLLCYGLVMFTALHSVKLSNDLSSLVTTITERYGVNTSLLYRHLLDITSMRHSLKNMPFFDQ